MKKLLFYFLLLFSSSLSLKATHNRSGEIVYTRIAPFGNMYGPVYTYSITLITYTDDGAGIADRCMDTLYFGDGQRAIGSRLVMPNSVSGCGCGTGVGCGQIIANYSNYRVKKNMFSFVHTYAGPGSYLVHFFDPNRNADIVNIPNSVNQPFYTEALIVATSTLGANSSPFPSNPPIDPGYFSSCYYHNPAVYDVDGDSISYEMVPCKIDVNTPAPNYTFPSAGPGGSFNINTDGDLNWCSPQLLGAYSMAIKITEWRRPSCKDPYQMIGYIVRDMQAVISGGTSPAVTPLPLTDTCMAAGGSVSKTFYGGAQNNILYVNAYGSCLSTQPTGSIVLNSGAGASAGFLWQTNCSLARKKPHRVYLTYEVYSGGKYARVYRPFDVKIVPPAVSASVAATGANSVTLTWQKLSCSDNISGYNVYRKPGAAGSFTHAYCEAGVPAGSGYYPVFMAGANDSTFTDIYLQPFANGSTMNYIVTAVSKDCQEGFAESTHSVSLIVGLKSYGLDAANTSVYPNPSENNFEITFGQAVTSGLHITLCAADGRMVYHDYYKQPGGSVKINGEALERGIYLLYIETSEGRICKKLVKD